MCIDNQETVLWLAADVQCAQIPASTLHFPRILQLAREEPGRARQTQVHVQPPPAAMGLDEQRQYDDVALRRQGPRNRSHFSSLARLNRRTCT